MARKFRAYATPNRATKQAKVLDEGQFDRLVKAAKRTAHAERDLVAIYLSFFCGLRASEIAGLRWDENILDADGKVTSYITITGDVGKNSVARTLPIGDTPLVKALKALRKREPTMEFVFHPIKDDYRRDPRARLSASAVSQWFRRFYALHNFHGCSSHSGRRSFITQTARHAPLNGCSMVDVQLLAGHRSMETTALYIEPSPNQSALVGGLYGRRAA